MISRLFSRRRALLAAARCGVVAVAAFGLAPLAATAQTPTKIRFQLDWRFEGPSALFLVPKAKGYFQKENLDVDVDAGSGSGAAISRVASGAYDMGFADLAALMEFVGNNPTAPNKPVAVMMVYNNTPAAVLSLKKSGIKTPADLAGKRLGAPVFDAGRKAFPIFAKANQIDTSKITWVAMDPPLRETMLVRGDIDAITGFTFTSLLNLNARGIKDDDVAIMPYPAYGVRLYGNAIIVSPDFLAKNPEAVKAFLRAFSHGVKDVLADPDGAVKTIKARDGLIDEALERRRLKVAIESSIATADARREGFGQVQGPRMALMATQVADAFATKERIDPAKIWNGSFLPSKDVLDVIGK